MWPRLVERDDEADVVPRVDRTVSWSLCSLTSTPIFAISFSVDDCSARLLPARGVAWFSAARQPALPPFTTHPKNVSPSWKIQTGGAAGRKNAPRNVQRTMNRRESPRGGGASGVLRNG